MSITITHNGTPNSISINGNPVKKSITIQSTALSTYQLAVENGYQGTEQEFIENITHRDTDFRAYYILSKN